MRYTFATIQLQMNVSNEGAARIKILCNGKNGNLPMKPCISENNWAKDWKACPFYLKHSKHIQKKTHSLLKLH